MATCRSRSRHWAGAGSPTPAEPVLLAHVGLQGHSPISPHRYPKGPRLGHLAAPCYATTRFVWHQNVEKQLQQQFFVPSIGIQHTHGLMDTFEYIWCDVFTFHLRLSVPSMTRYLEMLLSNWIKMVHVGLHVMRPAEVGKAGAILALPKFHGVSVQFFRFLPVLRN